VYAFDLHMLYPSWRALLPTIGAAMLIAAGSEAFVNRALLSQRPVVWIGLISYPLYLWHWPLLSFAHIFIGARPSHPVRFSVILASVLLAWLTYHTIEKPIRFGRRSRIIIAILCALLLALGSFGYVVLTSDGLPSREIARTNQQIKTLADERAAIAKKFHPTACDMNDSIVPLKIKKYCAQYGRDDAQETIVLWGDSHAGEGLDATAWASVFFQLADERGNTRIVRFSHPGCPPMIEVRRSDIAGNFHNCEDISQGAAVLAAIRKLKPSHVVMISRWSLYTHGMRNYDGALKSDSHFITTSSDGDATAQTGEAAYNKEFLPTVAALSSIANVLIIKNFPDLLNNVQTALAVRSSWYHSDNFRRLEPTLERHLQLSEVPFHLIDEAAKLPNVKVFDPAPYLCAETCKSIRDNVIMYWDDDHPSPEGAMHFKAEIKSLLQ
jgi:hypothetical protein